MDKTKVMEKNKQENMSMLSMLKIADLFTFANIASGLMAIIFAFNGHIISSSIFLILALIFDFLDGKVARWTKSQNEFGKQLDSLSDIISFGVAPAVITFTISQSSSWIPLYIFFVMCGAARLARFNVLNIKGFIGMPITLNGLMFPALYLISADILIIHIAMAISALLMVSGIRFRKI